MKKIILLSIAIITTFTINAQQVELPAPSPFAKVEQKVGLTNITIEYSRPGIKERTIFGGIVPYGETWRTGANENTKITFSDDVIINKKTLKAGTYALYTIPKQELWDIIFYSDTDNWGTPQEWDDAKVAAKTSVKATKSTEKTEWFTIDINNFKNDNSATIQLSWENTLIQIPFEVPTKTNVLASIESIMKGPHPNDYYQASVYYYQNDENLNKAKVWIDKAIELSKERSEDGEIPYWHIRLQSLIYNKLGNKKDAIKMAKKALKGALKAENESYANSIKENLKEWDTK